MRMQIEIQEVDASGVVLDDDIFAVVESDMLPPVGATMHLNGAGIFQVASHMWNVDPGIGLEPSIKVHVIVQKAVPIETMPILDFSTKKEPIE